MSADLFAEFNSLTQSPPAQSQNQTAQGSAASSKQLQQPLDFFGSSTSQTSDPAAGAQRRDQSHAQPLNPGAWNASQYTQGQQSFKIAAPHEATDDDDGWGDFETAEAQEATRPASQPKSTAWPSATSTRTAPPEPQKPKIVRAPTFELMTNSLVKLNVSKDQPKRVEWETGKVKPKLRNEPRDPSVMFDVEDFELAPGEEGDEEDDFDDEFGDFETVPAASILQHQEPPVAKPAAAPSADLLDLGFNEVLQQTPVARSVNPSASSSGMLGFGATSNAYPQAPRSPSSQTRSPLPKISLDTSTEAATKKSNDPASATPDTAWPSFESKKDGVCKDDDDDWGAWDDPPPTMSKSNGVDASEAPDAWDWDAVDHAASPPPRPAVSKQILTASARPDAAPPMNVPPPSVILSIFPELLGSADQLFKPLGSKNQSIKERVLSDPKALDFLKGYIFLASTAAHVIAGRKQRWHRDKILAKSMSISAAGSKGMKLAGVDKTQATREDREAADVVAAWQEYVGRLRSAVATANTAGGPTLKLPELGTSMHVQTAKMVPTAAKACVICGLKRDERVAKVDTDVEDSFGEWWVEHWGHRACQSFWLEHEQKLRQR